MYCDLSVVVAWRNVLSWFLIRWCFKSRGWSIGGSRTCCSRIIRIVWSVEIKLSASVTLKIRNSSRKYSLITTKIIARTTKCDSAQVVCFYSLIRENNSSKWLDLQWDLLLKWIVVIKCIIRGNVHYVLDLSTHFNMQQLLIQSEIFEQSETRNERELLTKLREQTNIYKSSVIAKHSYFSWRWNWDKTV